MILKIAHPIIPFITEEIWQIIGPLAKNDKPSIMLDNYPTYREKKIDPEAISTIDLLKTMVNECRRLRSEMNISPADKIPLAITGNLEIIKSYIPYLKALAKLSDIEILDELEEKEAPVSIIDDYKLMLKIEIDVEAEQGRLQKEIEKLDNEIKKCEAKLGNSSFMDKAPKQVVDQEKERLNGFNLSKQKFQAQLEKIS